MLSQKHGPRFPGLSGLIEKGVPSQEAIERVYGKPPGPIEQELKVYLGGNAFSGRMFTAKR
jgi:hypothetical protein